MEYPGKRKPKILLVDDRHENLIALQKVLANMEVDLVTAHNGNEALQQTLNHEFALALLDVQMPGMDGYELAEIMRSEEETADIPIIFISAIYTDRLNVFKGYEKGAFSFITKPFEPIKLLNKVEFFIERYHTRKAFDDSRTKYMDLYNSSPDMLISMNMETESIVECNATLLQHTGFSREELIGKSIYELYHPECIADVKRSFSGFMNSGEIENVELALKTKTGGRVDVLLNCKGLRDINGRIIHSNSSLRDISDLKKTRQQLEKTLEDLERTNKELENFIYITSHDLQEPMLTVISAIRLLQEELGEDAGKDVQTWIKYSTTAAERMKELITSLLNYLRVGMDKSTEELDFNLIVQEVLDEMFGSVDKSKARIEVGQLPVFHANRQEVKHLLQNLVSNAIKFKKDDRELVIEISCELEGDFARFAVKDNGIGIGKDSFQKVFKMFKQLHEHHKYPGVGIGMAICKKIVEGRGGNIWIESEKGSGTTFYFTLPHNGGEKYEQGELHFADR